MIGLLIASIVTYKSFSNLDTIYDDSSKISKSTSCMKSMLIGGLLYNSASGVVYRTASEGKVSQKAIKTMGLGIKKVSSSYKILKKIDSKLAISFDKEYKEFVSFSKSVVSRVNQTQELSEKDIKMSLKKWRELKFKIMPQIKKLKEINAKNEKLFSSSLSSSNSTIITTMVLLLIIIVIFSVVISNGITQSIEALSIDMKKFFSFLNQKANDVEKFEIHYNDEIGKMIEDINTNIAYTKGNLEKDRGLVQDISNLISELKLGHMSNRITSSATNKILCQLKAEVNEMLDVLQGHINGVIDEIEQYKNNDFVAKDRRKSEGTIYKLASGVNTLGDEISKLLVQNLKNGVDLQKYSTILAANVEQVSHSASAQADSLEDATRAIGTITHHIQNNTKLTDQMTTLGHKVRNSAHTGHDLARDTTKSMDEINEQTSSIDDSISVIDQIAFQTNILSLNAAVEAATAGEAGKGFAVVAGEVRNLAGRSAEAANNIKELVANANEKADYGKNIANKMIIGYDELTDLIDSTIKLIDEVSTASKAQAQEIDTVNHRIAIVEKEMITNVGVANKTNEIAIKTNEVADEVVNKAKEKNFTGKEEILSSSRSKSVDMNYQGRERRALERNRKGSIADRK
jgi:methyl-accepting chemotaxis protein